MDEQKSVYDDLSNTQAQKLELERTLDALQLEMKDSEEFIKALQAKLDQLHSAEITAKHLDGISFIYCPSCYAPIEDAGDHACSLCKSPFDKNQRSNLFGQLWLNHKNQNFVLYTYRYKIAFLQLHNQDL